MENANGRRKLKLNDRFNDSEELNQSNGSMEGQQFCLRWHNFQNTILSSLPKLLDGGYLTDVTLSAGGRHIRAHRIILSACSYYFKELFEDLSTMQHPVIVLPGMEYTNLCALVTFMYNGEVNIYQDQLPALLAMADALHIRGLADIAGKNVHQDNGLFIQPTGIGEDIDLINDTSVKEETSDSTLKSEIIDSASSHQSQDNTIIDDNNSLINDDEIPFSVKTKPYYSINAKLVQKEKKQNLASILQSGDTGNVSGNERNFPDKDDDTIINDERNSLLDDNKSNITIVDTNFRFLSSSTSSSPLTGRHNQMYNKTSVTCLICGKQLSNQYNLRVHMETHSNSSYSCSACSHVSRSRDALRKHVSYRHPVSAPQKRPRYSITKP